ncbi:MAG: V-type ATP synthase subunit B [Erysipelotrichaceae bacterium]
MKKQYLGLKDINGSLVILDNVQDAFFEEVVEFEISNGEKRRGRVIALEGDKCIVQVFEGTANLSQVNTKTSLTGRPMEIGLSEEIAGRIFNGSGQLIDNLPDIFVEVRRDINGAPLNPVSRKYPRKYINTGISAIDGLNTLIRGQKLPIFSGSGLPHNEIAAQIVRQAKITDGDEDNLAIVFAAMGVKQDVAQYFQKSFQEAGVMSKVTMFVNLANDPIIERILTPRCALSAAEYLAFDKGKQVLVIMTDMTAYCEALREFSSSKGEIPGRKGYPGYLYSDLSSLYERAGIIEGREGSLTQLPILTMPNDDITHPVPDLTGYITEGQISLDRNLSKLNIFPPVAVLPSLSRLMKDGIGEGFTRADHQPLANQLFAAYAKVQEARALAGVIGEDDLTIDDQFYMAFGRLFEEFYVGQGQSVNRDILETLELGWNLLSLMPKNLLDRLDDELIEKYHNKESALNYFTITLKKELDLIFTKEQ